jgi:hypothetical protein
MNPPGPLAAMDIHKTNAELSILSAGDEVRHPLPSRADDLCFISTTIRNHPMKSPGASFFALPEHRGITTNGKQVYRKRRKF